MSNIDAPGSLTLYSAIAADASKPFKIGVTFGSETLYLTKTKTASPNIADGITCSITAATSVSCEGGLTFYYNNLHPFEVALAPSPVKALNTSNQKWSIGPNNEIKWGAQNKSPNPNEPYLVTFSKAKRGSPQEIFAEICTTYGHPDGKDGSFIKGVAKAYFV